MELTAGEMQAGWFVVDIVHDGLAGHGLKIGDVAAFRPATKITPSRIYALKLDNPIPELRGYLLRLAIRGAGGKIVLYSAASAFDAEKVKGILPVVGELARVSRRHCR